MSPTVTHTHTHLLMRLIRQLPLAAAEEIRPLRERKEFQCVCARSSGVCVFMWDVLLKVSVYCVLKWSLLDLHRTTERC